MRPLTTHDLLAAWDAGQGQHAVDRALFLLSTACPEIAPWALAELTVGERDDRLLRLRELIFGSQLSGLAECPECGEVLELDFDAGQLRAPATKLALRVDQDDYCVEFRVPHSRDLQAIRAAPDVASARRILLDRCITSGTAADLPEHVVQTIADVLAKADPQGDIQLALECPTCETHWEQAFDIGSFLWIEIQAWAMRTLREVHQLASAYGWSESDILSMNPWRRTAYLEMLGA